LASQFSNCGRKVYWSKFCHNFLHSRLCLLLGPSLFSITLLLITVFPTNIKTLPRVMLIVVTLDVFWRVALFFQLLELDFQFRIVTGSEYGDRILHDVFFQISVFIIHLFPLYIPTLLIVFVQHYRMQVYFSETVNHFFQ
uniref:EXS domain-containing protein n=1 Tax=Angiostrongylus costaricensis TaxID=334426 RepID=A0A0R3PCM6_ANGCS